MMKPAQLVRETRRRHSLSQTSLAIRARTTQRQISRIERGEISPSVEMIERLLRAMGEQLVLDAVTGPTDNRSDAELRADYRHLTPAERIAQTAELSRTLTGIAASRKHE
jgi:transcriptional regulator with XRE-family HTH domain